MPAEWCDRTISRDGIGCDPGIADLDLCDRAGCSRCSWTATRSALAGGVSDHLSELVRVAPILSDKDEPGRSAAVRTNRSWPTVPGADDVTTIIGVWRTIVGWWLAAIGLRDGSTGVRTTSVGEGTEMPDPVEPDRDSAQQCSV